MSEVVEQHLHHVDQLLLVVSEVFVCVCVFVCLCMYGHMCT